MILKRCLRLEKHCIFSAILHRCATSTSSKPYFITTPIFYVNADPHIGHLYSLVIADALKRYHELSRNQKAVFTTGTDEHGIKVQRAADAKQVEPIQFCDQISQRFRSLCDTFSISNTDFIRTSEERHHKAVGALWRTLYDRGWIYKGKHVGWYCPADEAFVPNSNVTDIVRDGQTVKVTLDTQSPVEWCEEENYMFRLTSFRGDLLSWLKADQTIVKPRKFYDLLVHLVEQEPRDLSVSRPRSRVKWGIPVPGDETHSIYVWLDALVNYLTVLGYPDKLSEWPPDCHVIGKDILKFHGVYWPSFLLAAGLELPRQLFCHSHWTVNETKMSKSKGNIVDPFDMANRYTAEGFRYYLLRTGVPHSDGNFSEGPLKSCLNAELADNFGNLLLRCSAPSINKSQTYPSVPEGAFSQDMVELLKELDTLREQVEHHFACGHFYSGITAVMDVLRRANAVTEHQKPWQLAKIGNEELLTALIFSVFETLRISAILLQPVIPNICDRVLTKLNVSQDGRQWSRAQPFLYKDFSKLNTDKIMIFQKLR